MRHQNYTEYLRKEIDFLKILVDRFHDQEKFVDLELEIALLKTRDIYEQLLKMKLMSDINPSEIKHVEFTKADIGSDKGNPVQDRVLPPPEKLHIENDIIDDLITENIISPVPVTEKKETGFEKEIRPPAELKIHQEKKEIVVEEKQNNGKNVEILAEKIKPTGLSPINETLAQRKPIVDLSRKFQSKPLNKMASGIGLNDKFLFTKELFKGDSGKYLQTLQELDNVSSFDDAMDIISKNFKWDNEAEVTRKFLDIVYRRHGLIK